jgi:phospholipid/cholesterol/gamma-HCH transport system permease protein
MFVSIGRVTRVFFEAYGRMTILLARGVRAFRRAPSHMGQIGEQYRNMGRRSLPMVLVGSVFVGFVLGVQIGTQISAGTPLWIEAGLILQSVLLEMGPIITGLVLAGRVGSGIASELGTMNVTEQVDALRILGLDPIEVLVMPRLIAGMLAVPILTVVFDFTAILSGFVSTYYTIGISWVQFVRGMRAVFNPTEMYTSIIKGFVFGVIITISGCFFGLEAKVGAKGVGKATTSAVATASISIIVVDYLISASLFHVW